MSRPAFYNKFPELWALRCIVRWVPCLGDAERQWLIDRLRLEVGQPAQPLPTIGKPAGKETP